MMLELFGQNLAITMAIMFGLWLVSLAIRDVSIVDVFWGFGFVVIASLAFFATGEATHRKLLLIILTAAWGLRLTLHLARRKIGTPEDYRYRAMREKIGPRFWIVSLFLVFVLQGVIMNVVALPVVAGQWDRSDLNWANIVGIGVWLIGFVFETVGDWQLTAFQADPGNHGKVMACGLWRYTRHPNYFGDFMIWRSPEWGC